MTSLRFMLSATLLICVCTFATGQQFQLVANTIIGPTVWSEGVETLDANGDGLLDLIFTNGSGFSSAGGSLRPTLLINTGTVGSPSFIDRSATGIPAGFVQQGKGLAACDIDQDGDPDIVFANGFQTQQRILINDGTGVFTDETATRFPTLILSAFGVAPIDVENDGDLDLVFCNTGPSLLGAPGGMPRLLINDGSGFFTEAPMQMNGVNKRGAMQVSAVDIDNDFDIDIVIDGRSTGQHLYLNDGNGTFSFTSTVLPVGSTFVYETDWADLDNDGDSDGFYVSMSGFNEGSARNNLIPSGTLSFTGTTSTLSGLNGNDDNEVAYLDANNDGLLDVVLASLSGSREKLYLNAGTFAAGSFAYQSSGFTTLGDSSLDLAIGDFDRDGRYDVVTAQGESGSFVNRYYRNTGPIDTTAPRIGRIETLPATVSRSNLEAGAFSIRAWIQDSVYDSGRTYVSAFADLTVSKDGVTTLLSFPMTYGGGQIWRFGVPATMGLDEVVGASVSIDIRALDPAGNSASMAAGSFVICGENSFGLPNAVNSLTLSLTSTPQAGTPASLSLTASGPNLGGVLVTGPNRTALPLVGGILFVSLPTATLSTFTTNAMGQASFMIPVASAPMGIGQLIRAQAGVMSLMAPQGWSLSNGLEFGVCGP